MKKFLALVALSLTLCGNAFADGIDAYTKLMLHGDGSDGGVLFTDSSPIARTMTYTGTVTTKTDQSVFGGSSIKFTNGRVKAASSTDFNIGTGDFSIDYRIRSSSFGGYAGIWDIGSAYNGAGILMQIQSNKHVYIFINGGAGGNLIIDYNWTGGTNAVWYHMALVRSGTSLKLYIDGVNVATAVSSHNITTSTYGFTLGNNEGTGGANNPYSGYIEEFRFDVGVARWTANFTPPSSAYSAASVSKSYILADG